MIPVLRPHLTLSDLISFLNICHNPKTQFEKKLQTTFKAKHSLTYSSARAGLYHILKANQIKNKNILISAYTCCVVTKAIVQSGNTPVFIDPAKNSFNGRLTPDIIKKHQKNLGAVIVTNLFGLTDFPDPDFLTKNRKFLLILDDALTPSHIKDRPKHLYDYVIISCNVRKPLTCLGGGLVLTDSHQRYQQLNQYTITKLTQPNLLTTLKKFLLTCTFFIIFKPFFYPLVLYLKRNTKILTSFFNEKHHRLFTINPEYFEPMTNYQKRLGLNQLKKFAWLTKRRQTIGNLYLKLLRPHFNFVRLYWSANTPFSHLPFLHPKRDQLANYLNQFKIDTEKYFDYSIPQIKQYQVKGQFPQAKYLANQIINLPTHPYLSKKTIIRIVNQILNFN